MTDLRNDFKPVDNDTPKPFLVRAMSGADISEVLGLHAPNLTGAVFGTFKAYIQEHLGASLVAVEPRSKEHPHGMIVGYALLKNQNIYGGEFGLSNIFVHPQTRNADACADALIRGSARVCMAKGQNKMDVFVPDKSPGILALCQKFEAARHKTSAQYSLYSITDLSGKFGYGAEKKARELKL